MQCEALHVNIICRPSRNSSHSSCPPGVLVVRGLVSMGIVAVVDRRMQQSDTCRSMISAAHKHWSWLSNFSGVGGVMVTRSVGKKS